MGAKENRLITRRRKVGDPTQVINNIGLAPLGPVQARTSSGLVHAGVEKQNVQSVLVESLKGLLCERFDRPEVGKVQRQDGDAVRLRIVLHLVKGCLGGFEVPRANDELAWLRLLQQLLD